MIHRSASIKLVILYIKKFLYRDSLQIFKLKTTNANALQIKIITDLFSYYLIRFWFENRIFEY